MLAHVFFMSSTMSLFREATGCDVEVEGVETKVDLPVLFLLLASVGLLEVFYLLVSFCTWGVVPCVVGPLLLKL